MIELELYPKDGRKNITQKKLTGAKEWEEARELITSSAETLSGFVCYLDDIIVINGVRMGKKGGAGEWHIRIIAGNETTAYTLHQSREKDLSAFLIGITRKEYKE